MDKQDKLSQEIQKIAVITPRGRLNMRILFLVSLTIIALVYFISYWNTRDVIENQNFIAESYKLLQLSDFLNSTLLNAQSSRRGYLLTGNAEFLESYRSSIPLIDTVFPELKKLAASSVIQKANVDTLWLLVLQDIDFLERGIALQHKRGRELELHKPLLEKGRNIQDRIGAMITKIKEYEVEQLNRKNEVVESGTKYTLWVLIGGTILSILLLLVVYSLLERAASHGMDAEQEKTLRRELEEIVKDRTAEIGEINRKLSAQILKYQQTERMLKELEKDFRGLFENAMDAMIIYNPEDFKVVDANEQACRVYQIPREKFVNLSLKTLFKNIPEEERYLNKVIIQESPLNFQTVHYRSDGTEMLMEINASAIDFEGRRVILSINRDITERILEIPANDSKARRINL